MQFMIAHQHIAVHSPRRPQTLRWIILSTPTRPLCQHIVPLSRPLPRRELAPSATFARHAHLRVSAVVLHFVARMALPHPPSARPRMHSCGVRTPPHGSTRPARLHTRVRKRATLSTYWSCALDYARGLHCWTRITGHETHRKPCAFTCLTTGTFSSRSPRVP